MDDEQRIAERPDRRIPPAVALFGSAGLLPPVAAAVALFVLPPGLARQIDWVLLVFYAALIFSFLGGSWWAFSAAEPRASWLFVAVAPSLVALALLLALIPAGTRFPATVLLAMAIAASPLADRALAAAGLAPAWWLRLRVPLSLGLALCVAVAAARVPA